MKNVTTYLIVSLVSLISASVINIFIMLMNVATNNTTGIFLNSILWLFLGYCFGIFKAEYSKKKMGGLNE